MAGCTLLVKKTKKQKLKCSVSGVLTPTRAFHSQLVLFIINKTLVSAHQ